ncbi:MAG: hypothetical protein HY321_12825 [Armatimonadetes bacterium]|nr:hypothetical protein [Armatimonadota bacterium]
MRPILVLLLALTAAASHAQIAAPTPEMKAEAEALLTQALGVSAEERIPLLTRALQIVPDEARCWVAAGDAYAFPDYGEQPAPPPGQAPEPPKPLSVEQGRRCYEQGAKLAPDSPLPHLRLADLAWENDKATAAAHLERAIALDPKNALPLYERALLHFLAGEDDRGRERVLAAAGCDALHYPLIMPPGAMNLVQASRCTALLAAQSNSCLSRVRLLSRQIIRVAGEVPADSPDAAERARAMLLEGQRLTYRMVAAEPGLSIHALVGIAIDATVDTPLRFFFLGRGDRAALARLDTRKRAMDLIRERMAALPARLNAETGRLNPLEANIHVFRAESETVAAALAASGLKPTSEE